MSIVSRASSEHESTDGQRSSSKHSSDTSSAHSGDSPKLRRSKLKLIKNLKPDIIKRPSSFMVSDPSTNTGGNVAGINLKKTDCTLVGYRKTQQTTAVPLYELGTLSGPPDTVSMGSGPTKTALYNAASMPTLLAKGHVSMIQSGSMPELFTNASIRNSSPPDLVTAVRARISGSGLCGLSLDGPAATSSVSGTCNPSKGDDVQSGADPVPRDARSSSTTPSDSSTSANVNIENGYVSSNSDSNDKSSPELEGLKKGQMTGDHVGDYESGVDYNLLADTLTKALGEPEAVDMNDATDVTQFEDGKPAQCSTNSAKPGGSILDFLSKFEASDSGKGDSFSDAPLSDSTKDRLGSLTSGEFQIDSSLVESILANGSSVGTSRKDSDSESLISNEYTIFELLKEEMKRQDAALAAASSSTEQPPGTVTAKHLSNRDIIDDKSSSSCPCVASSSQTVAREIPVNASQPIISQPRPGVVNAMVSSSSTPELSALHRDKEQKLVSPVGDHTIK